MKYGNIILGILLLQVIVCARASVECPLLADPNNYIENPDKLDNGLFECGDENLTLYDFTPPIFWERSPHPNSDIFNLSAPIDCYASLHDYFNSESSNSDWVIQKPYEGNTFAVLSTGGIENNNAYPRLVIESGSIVGSTISQKVFLTPGDTITGAYFFGTDDYLPYFDWGQIAIHLAADPNDYPDSVVSFVIPGTYCDVTTVGNYLSTLDFSPETDGWISFEYTFEPNQMGPYFLTCEVADKGDNVVNSYYAVDGLRICRGGKPVGDLNNDCDVNLLDYSIVSEAWLTFCPDIAINDPNFPGDPNDYPTPVTNPDIPCQEADLDNNWFVELFDLFLTFEEGIYNTEHE